MKLSQSVTMTPEEYRLLREVVYEHAGLSFGDDMKYLLERRLTPRLEFHGLSDFASYYRLLSGAAERRSELETAVELLTTNETYLYREPRQLLAFSQEIVPQLARDASRRQRLRIWSAGCSTGEEVYTIAALILRSGLFPGWDLEVFGSDISRRALATARAGIYGGSAFRSPEAEILRSSFQQEGDRWRVKEEIRELASFGHLNLLDDHATGMVGPFDAIFCRNVMIYFDVPARKRVVRAFHGALREGGYLLLGHSESLINVTSDFEMVQLRHAMVHRKPWSVS